MREVKVGKPEAQLCELPIHYWLDNRIDYINVNAQVGSVVQTLFILYPNKVSRVGFVSKEIGLEMDGYTISVDD